MKKSLFLVLVFLLVTLVQAQETPEATPEVTTLPVYDEGYSIWWFTKNPPFIAAANETWEVEGEWWVFYYNHSDYFNYGSNASFVGADGAESAAPDGTVIAHDYSALPSQGWTAIYYDDQREPYTPSPLFQEILDSNPICTDLAEQREDWGLCGLYFQQHLQSGDHYHRHLEPRETVSYGIHRADTNTVTVSPDGRFLAYVVSFFTNEANEFTQAFIIVFDTATARHYLIANGLYQAPLRWHDNNVLEASWEGEFNSSFEILYLEN